MIGVCNAPCAAYLHFNDWCNLFERWPNMGWSPPQLVSKKNRDPFRVHSASFRFMFERLRQLADPLKVQATVNSRSKSTSRKHLEVKISGIINQLRTSSKATLRVYFEGARCWLDLCKVVWEIFMPRAFQTYQNANFKVEVAKIWWRKFCRRWGGKTQWSNDTRNAKQAGNYTASCQRVTLSCFSFLAVHAVCVMLSFCYLGFLLLTLGRLDIDCLPWSCLFWPHNFTGAGCTKVPFCFDHHPSSPQQWVWIDLALVDQCLLYLRDIDFQVFKQS